MNIFNLLSQNLGHGSRTRAPDNSVPYPAGYRGRIEHAADLCTGCGTCTYVCSPGAIAIEENSASLITWKYREDRCAFCAFCVSYCPTQALSTAAVSPALLSERPQHYLTHPITLPPCRECGQPVRKLPEQTLRRLYGDPLPEEIVAARGLCERCRQRVTGERFVKAIAGKRGEHDK